MSDRLVHHDAADYLWSVGPFADEEDELNVRVVGDVQQDEDGQVPEAGALQLCGVAAVEEALVRGAQVTVVQRLQDAPQVPAQTVVQTLPGDGQRLQQLLQAVVSAGTRSIKTYLKPGDVIVMSSGSDWTCSSDMDEGVLALC